MKGSLIIMCFFILGVTAGCSGLLNINEDGIDFSFVALGALIFCVGISIGSDLTIFGKLRSLNWLTLFLPFFTIAGSLSGAALISFFCSGRSLSDVLAVGSGFAYYSLSSIFITEYRGPELGTVALIANIFRELVTLLGAPVIYRFFGPLAPIASGGATTLDTTLPIITAVSGKEFTVLSIYHGFVVDFSVPFLVTLFCRL